MSIWIAGILAFAQPGSNQASPAPPRVESLSWLAGEWEHVDHPDAHTIDWTIEHWSRPRAGMMLGTSLTSRRTTGGGMTTREEGVRTFEYMRIAAGPDGRITFFASPNGGPAVAFPVARIERYVIVFENAANDYPQRISYRWDANIIGETLTATISLIDGSRPMTWTYRRPQAPMQPR